MWQQGDAQSDAGTPTWEEALGYCEGLSLGNHNDWRLPNYRELTSLVDYSRYKSPAIDPVFQCRSNHYLSSSTNAYEPYDAWVVDFRDGQLSVQYKHDSPDVRYVRCVRGGPGGSVGPSVTIKAADPTASEPGIDKGKFVVSRTGNTSKSLTVYYQIAGTAINGVDYRNLSGKITIPIGKASANLYVKPIDDKAKEPVESVKVRLLKKASYKVGSSASATVNIADND
jgi:hypothetical protein